MPNKKIGEYERNHNDMPRWITSIQVAQFHPVKSNTSRQAPSPRKIFTYEKGLNSVLYTKTNVKREGCLRNAHLCALKIQPNISPLRKCGWIDDLRKTEIQGRSYTSVTETFVQFQRLQSFRASQPDCFSYSFHDTETTNEEKQEKNEEKGRCHLLFQTRMGVSQWMKKAHRDPTE